MNHVTEAPTTVRKQQSNNPISHLQIPSIGGWLIFLLLCGAMIIAFEWGDGGDSDSNLEGDPIPGANPLLGAAREHELSSDELDCDAAVAALEKLLEELGELEGFDREKWNEVRRESDFLCEHCTEQMVRAGHNCH